MAPRKRGRTIITLPRNLAEPLIKTEVVAEVNPPTTNLGENMPVEIMKGKVPAEESGELIVWDNRQRIP